MLLCMMLLAGLPALGSALGTSARAVIPADVQQIISVDYRALKASPTAVALKNRVLPDYMKEFEGALAGVGINPDTDVEQLTFASFRGKGANSSGGLQFVGIVQGQFTMKKILARLAAKKVKGVRYRLAALYPMPGGQDMTFLDDFTMLFGPRAGVKAALDARDGEAPALSSGSPVADNMNAVQSGTVWSVLDQAGTQNMMRSTLGEAAQLADYEMVKKRILGSRYTMDFDSGVNFDLDVVTADSMTAATLSSVLKAGVLFRKATANGVEKIALDSVSVDSDSSNLKLHFKTDNSRFQSLLQSDLFAQVSK